MFVRWKVKPRSDRKKKPVNLFVAYLVASVRVNGQPRQKQHYLASIKDQNIQCSTHQAVFWSRVSANLQPLQLTTEQSQKIEEKLLERVPKPDAEQLQAAIRMRKAMF